MLGFWDTLFWWWWWWGWCVVCGVCLRHLARILQETRRTQKPTPRPKPHPSNPEPTSPTHTKAQHTTATHQAERTHNPHAASSVAASVAGAALHQRPSLDRQRIKEERPQIVHQVRPPPVHKLCGCAPAGACAAGADGPSLGIWWFRLRQGICRQIRQPREYLIVRPQSSQNQPCAVARTAVCSPGGPC